MQNNTIQYISNEQYHASDSVSRSMLSELKKSPYHYWYKYLSGVEASNESTKSLDSGSAIHTLILEPHKFNDEFFVHDLKRMPNKGSAAHKELLDTANGRIILSQKEMNTLSVIANSVTSDPFCKALFTDCAIENSIFFTHEETGIPCRVRPDAWQGTLGLDLKSTKDASPKGFRRAAYNYDYYLQGAMNFVAFDSIGVHLDEFIFVAVEKEPPYANGVFRMIRDEDAYQLGMQQFNERMALLKECIDNDEWPGYGIKKLGI